MQKLMIICAFLGAFSGITGNIVNCEDTPRVMNVIAQRLLGTWIIDNELSGRLGVSNIHIAEITFSENPSILSEFPKLNPSQDFCAYLIGTMNFIATNNEALLNRPFALISLNGMPHILWLKKYGAEGTDAELFEVAVFQGADPSKDLLALGDDQYSPRTPMHIFNRLIN